MYQSHPIKRYLPRTLFGRALLIMIVPAVLVQVLAVIQFYERHWDSVVRNMSASLAGEVVLVHQLYPRLSLERLQEIGRMLGMEIRLDTRKQTVFEAGRGRDDYPEFYDHLKERLGTAFMVEQAGPQNDLLISLLVDTGTLRIETGRKRLVSSTTYIFLLWTAGSSLVLLAVATLFLRNQIRPIRQLAAAAEKFGLGQEEDTFQPRGASEVRQAGRAFVIMRNRIERQVKARTDMLAGISHDLRTPLTRMKLQLAMLQLDDRQRAELASDIEEMEHMIEEYLQFARGLEQEETEPVVIDRWLSELVEGYLRQQQAVRLEAESGLSVPLRPRAMRRAMCNIIDNALHYGNEAVVSTQEDGAYLVIAVRDKGPGIPENAFEDVFRPFTRLDQSRSPDRSGAGLGLSIARDIIQAHGGTIELRNRKRGLEVVVNLPQKRIEGDGGEG